MNTKIGKKSRKVRKHGLVFFAGFAFAIGCFLLINMAMKPASSSEYCGGKCHEMNTAYQSWELSVHGANKYGVRIECVNCHLPPKDEFFKHITAKVYGGLKDVYKHHFSDYDNEKAREKARDHMTNRRCVHCHNSLLTKPGSSAARMAHMEVLNLPGQSKIKCIDCHEDIGHQRENKMFSP